MDSVTVAWFHGIFMGIAGTLFFDRFILIPAIGAWYRFLRRHGGRTA